MAETYKTNVKADGNNTGIEVPSDVLAKLGSSKKPAVKVSLSGYEYRSTVATVSGAYMIPLSAAHREASGLKAGDPVEVTLEIDDEPRTVDVPPELGEALAKAGLKAKFDALSYSKRKEFARQVADAKTQETRDRRLAVVIEKLRE